MPSNMRKSCLIRTGRCYRLTNRLVHRAFSQVEEETHVGISLMSNDEEFWGVITLMIKANCSTMCIEYLTEVPNHGLKI